MAIKNPGELEFNNIDEKLMFIQNTLKVEKGHKNDFAKFDYRTLSDILENVKPLLEQTNCNLRITDKLIGSNGLNYIEATVTLSDGEDEINATAVAREAVNKKGMDDPQMSGTASTYARKYACNGLFAIDDTRDPDSMDNREQLHHNGSPVKKGCVTQDQSIKMDRLARDAKTLPMDKEKLKAIAKAGYVISPVEAEIHIQDAKEGQNAKFLGKKIIAEWTKKFATLGKEGTEMTAYLDKVGWTEDLLEKAMAKYDKIKTKENK